MKERLPSVVLNRLPCACRVRSALAYLLTRVLLLVCHGWACRVRVFRSYYGSDLANGTAYNVIRATPPISRAHLADSGSLTIGASA
jgi:hypothetical protein